MHPKTIPDKVDFIDCIIFSAWLNRWNHGSKALYVKANVCEIALRPQRCSV